MPQPTSPVAIVGAMIRRKNGTRARLVAEGLSPSHPQDAINRSVRMAETLASIETLEEVRDEIMAMEPSASDVFAHRLHCTANTCCLEAVSR